MGSFGCTRRDFLKALGLGAASLGLSGCASAPATLGASRGDGKASKERPNILFCIADDWAWPHASIAGDKENMLLVCQKRALGPSLRSRESSLSLARAYPAHKRPERPELGIQERAPPGEVTTFTFSRNCSRLSVPFKKLSISDFLARKTSIFGAPP